MKKFVIYLTMFIAFILLIGESETITIGVILAKILSLTYLWIVAKANNYFYQDRRNYSGRDKSWKLY